MKPKTNRARPRLGRVGALATTTSFCVMAALLLTASGSEGLTLSNDYNLPIWLPEATEYEVDTTACQDATITGQGWVYGWLATDSGGDVVLRIGLPSWHPQLAEFTFCEDPIDDFDETMYELSLDEYTELSGGNRLRLVFDIPTSPDDLVVDLHKGTPKFDVLWDGNEISGVSTPMTGTNFNWTVE